MSRVSKVREGENWIIRVIQPKWAIEEYARIFRSCVWFRPPQPPIRVDETPKIIKRVGLLGWSWRNRAKGASFCHVDKIRPVVKSRP